MAIEQVVTKLRAKLASISGGTKKQFLDGFKTIHNAWHMAEMNKGVGTFGGQPLGFLSFHHEVVSVYVSKFAPGLAPGTDGKDLAALSPPHRRRAGRSSVLNCD